jgi:kynurenine formamidase
VTSIAAAVTGVASAPDPGTGRSDEPASIAQYPDHQRTRAAFVRWFAPGEEGALKKQNLALQPADAIIIHTGSGKMWGKDNVRFTKSCPAIGVKTADWLISKDPTLLGSDNFPVEMSSNSDPKLSGPVHQIALVINGVHLLENLKLDELVAKNVGDFAFIMEPLKIQGATGSTVTPVAVR